jgi:hypothetical protein
VDDRKIDPQLTADFGTRFPAAAVTRSGDGVLGSHSARRNVDLGSACSSYVMPTTKGATMKFLMLVCWDAEQMNAQTEPDPSDTQDKESFPWLDDLQARGIWVTGDQLAPPRRAKTVRVRDGKKMITDGPFAETKEVVGGFDLLECDSLEEAVEIAAAHPVAQIGTIEVRPLWGK